jgi:hypothetical protein
MAAGFRFQVSSFTLSELHGGAVFGFEFAVSGSDASRTLETAASATHLNLKPET